MTKAERRKRSRQRAKERERAGQSPGVEAGSSPLYLSLHRGVPQLYASGVRYEPEPTAGDVSTLDPVIEATGTSILVESPFITGPVAPKATVAVPSTRAVRIELPDTALIHGEPEEDSDEDPEGDEKDDDEDETEESDDSEDGDDDGEDEDADDDEDEDDDEEDDAVADADDDAMDAVFNAACAAVEQGDRLSWNEVLACLCEAEVNDPRLGLVVALLLHDGAHPLPLTGERLLTVLTDMGLPDVVAEAREVATLTPGEAGDTPEERAIVRTNARELRDQATTELASGNRSTKPLKASDLKKRSALGGVVPLPVSPSGRATR